MTEKENITGQDIRIKFLQETGTRIDNDTRQPDLQKYMEWLEDKLAEYLRLNKAFDDLFSPNDNFAEGSEVDDIECYCRNHKCSCDGQ